jgi:hypothetical protein
LILTLGAIALAIAAGGCGSPSAGSGEASPDRRSAPPIENSRIEWSSDRRSTRVTVRVVGPHGRLLSPPSIASLTPDQWSSLFSVAIGEAAGGRPRAPMLGTYQTGEDTITFIPRFPLEPGVTYRATYSPKAFNAIVRAAHSWSEGHPALDRSAADPIVAEITLLARDAEATTHVTHVYPSSDVLPENLLRFYVHFSAPMSLGEAYDRVRLLDGSGKPVDLPFLELAEELWDPRGKRLTLLLDPGRIKTGLKPREEAGPILEKGKSYTLVIERTWPDAAGAPLQAEFRKVFRVGEPDLRSPDPRTWKLVAPSRPDESLVVDFPEPLDHAMLGRVLHVSDSGGKVVAGRIDIEANETRWRFTPARPWAAGRYDLVVDKLLEDRAGNNIERPFEVDVFTRVERRETADTVRLPLEVKSFTSTGAPAKP